MIWKHVEVKIRNSMYPNLIYWNVYIFPYQIKNSIYQKHFKNLHIQFEHIPENWLSVRYYLFFDKFKGYYYPTNDDIKFFNFNLFKKNGFIFLLFFSILFRNCYIELLFLLIKSLFAFYLILDFIYIIFLIRKYVIFLILLFYYLPLNFVYIFILININNLLNKYLKLKNKWYF